MINLNESSRLSNVLQKVFTDSSLKQIKEGITSLVQDKNNLPKSDSAPVYAYLFFSEKMTQLFVNLQEMFLVTHNFIRMDLEKKTILFT